RASLINPKGKPEAKASAAIQPRRIGSGRLTGWRCRTEALHALRARAPEGEAGRLRRGSRILPAAVPGLLEQRSQPEPSSLRPVALLSSQIRPHLVALRARPARRG